MAGHDDAGMPPSLTTRRPDSTPTCQDCAIRKSCTLNRLGSQDRMYIAPRIRERVAHRGDVLQDEGETAIFVRVVKTGLAFCYRRGLDNRSRPVGIVRRGGALGIFAMLGMPNLVRCVALTDLRVCEISVAGLARASAGLGSQLTEEVTRAVVGNFTSAMTWSEAMRLLGVVNQLAYVIVLLAEENKASVVELPSQAALAELLGTRRETIARALRTLEGEGGLRLHERRRCEVFRDKLLARLSADAH